jgi:hypothetical protein
VNRLLHNNLPTSIKEEAWEVVNVMEKHSGKGPELLLKEAKIKIATWFLKSTFA